MSTQLRLDIFIPSLGRRRVVTSNMVAGGQLIAGDHHRTAQGTSATFTLSHTHFRFIYLTQGLRRPLRRLVHVSPTHLVSFWRGVRVVRVIITTVMWREGVQESMLVCGLLPGWLHWKMVVVVPSPSKINKHSGSGKPPPNRFSVCEQPLM